jgi:hypothetical protein
MACQRQRGINHEPHWSSPEQGDTPCTHYRRIGKWIAKRSARIDMGLNAFCRLSRPQHRRTATEDQRYEEASQPAPVNVVSRSVSTARPLRVGERNSAEIARVMASYFRARDEFEPVSRDELLDRLRWGTATVLMCVRGTSSRTATCPMRSTSRSRNWSDGWQNYQRIRRSSLIVAARGACSRSRRWRSCVSAGTEFGGLRWFSGMEGSRPAG